MYNKTERITFIMEMGKFTDCCSLKNFSCKIAIQLPSSNDEFSSTPVKIVQVKIKNSLNFLLLCKRNPSSPIEGPERIFKAPKPGVKTFSSPSKTASGRCSASRDGRPCWSRSCGNRTCNEPKQQTSGQSRKLFPAASVD